tara:strand:+ start:1658 stop:2524 length:867 start_codon:yes stop_codon:yes gene_type:complete
VNYLISLRPWQWVKNLLIFVPFILSSNAIGSNFIEVFITFLTFSFFVSGTYILNDINDVELDKMHLVKRNRPIASGKIQINQAKIFAYFLCFSNLLISYFTKVEITIFMIIYLLITTAYSKYLKFKNFYDSSTIALLFLIRLQIGGIAADINVTINLSLFIFFLSYLLSMSKKISIINNKESLDENKFKQILIIQNQEINFDFIQIVLISLSNFTFIFWILENIYSSTNQIKLLFLILSLILFFLLTLLIFKNSKNGVMEDFIISIFKTKELFITALLFGLSFLIGYF